MSGVFKRFVCFMVMVLILGFGQGAWAQVINDLRFSSQPTSIRLVADLSDKAEVNVFRLSHPSRLVLDFKNTKMSAAAMNKTFDNTGFVGSVRKGAPDASTARLVLDLPDVALEEKHFLLSPQAGNSWRFVLDLKAKDGVVVPVSTAAVATTAASGSGQNLRPFSQARKKVVVLDPGHGGKDPGAISKAGRYEKDLVLKMAKETKTFLEKAGYKVVLTRDRDVYLTLRQRIQKAHEANADLFISVHADSAKNTSARGLSIYTISEKASDAEAAALAERENKADILFGMDLAEYQPEVGNILIDFAKKYTMDQSAHYAKYVVNEMKRNVKLVPDAHRFAGFVVLKSPNIPSVLLEMGYMSNVTEEKLMQKKSYRNDLSEALVRAVNTYFRDHDI